MATAQREPSTEWSEVVDPAEAQRHKAFADELVKIQSRIDLKHGPGRVFHRKQVLGLKAAVEILADLPDYARQGLFSRPATYEAIARLSNGGMEPQPDAIPDVRGFAFSIRGLTGPAALGGQTDRQDFALINRPIFGFHTSEDFAAIAQAAAQSQAAVMKAFVELYGPTGGPVAAAKMAKDLFRRFTGFATEPFFSAVPIQFGQYAGRLRMHTQGENAHLRAALDFGKDMAARLAEHAVIYDLQAQFFVDETITPIEDGTIDWPEEESPFIDIGVLTLPIQDPGSAEGIDLSAAVEIDKFDPWAALLDHKPLGEIMRARKVAYFPSAKHREATGT